MDKQDMLELVLVRLERSILDGLKADTGALADATAVACFCRKEWAAKQARKGDQ